MPRRERAARFEEGLRLITRLWTEPEVTFKGRFYQVDKASLAMQPARKPHPPIWIGATAEAGIERVLAEVLPADKTAKVAELQARGFVPVLLESLAMGEKATLFSQAEVVVGASGAGLPNLVFCEPGAKVIVICTRGYAMLDAWDIANRVGVDYWYRPDSLDGLVSVLDAADVN